MIPSSRRKSSRTIRYFCDSYFRDSLSHKDLETCEFHIEALEPRMMLNADVGDLIFQADFEDVDVEDGKFGFFREVSGLTASGVPVEVQNNVSSVGPASQGNQHLELDGISGVATNIATTGTDELLLKFDYSPRPGVSLSGNSIEVWWDGNLLETVSRDGESFETTNFREFEVNLSVGEESETSLEFRSNDPTDNLGLGGLLDNIRVYQLNTFAPLNLDEIEDQVIAEGARLDLFASISDPDSIEDARYSIDGPEGMTINRRSGRIRWIASREEIAAANGQQEIVGERQLVFQSLFEDVDVESGSFGLFAQVSGFEAGRNRVEVQDNPAIVGPSSEGDQHLELDGLNSIIRDVTTVPGDRYQLVLDYSPRPGVDELGNTIEVWWGGELVSTLARDGSDSTTTDFRQVEIDLSRFNGDLSRLEFRSVNADDAVGLGGLLDNVRLYRSPVEIVDAEDKFLVTVSVTDASGQTDSESFLVCVEEAEPVTNRAPVLAPIPDQTVNEGQELFFNVTATDADGDDLTYSLAQASVDELEQSRSTTPSAASIDPVTGEFRWTPNELSGPGEYDFVVTATDLEGATDRQTFTIVVTEVNLAPVLDPIPDQAVLVGNTLVLTATGSDDDLPPNELSFSLGQDAPEGATIDPVSGLFRWTPDESYGDTSIELSVILSDGQGGIDSTRFRIEIATGNVAPVLQAIPDQVIDEGRILNVFASATDDSSQRLIYELDSAPEGMTINPNTGRIRFATGEVDGPGDYSVIVSVTNPFGAADTTAFRVVVNEINIAPEFEEVADQLIGEGDTLMLTVLATDSDLPANELTFSVVAGPDDLELDPKSGAITWTAPELIDEDLTITVTLLVADEAGAMDQTSFDVTVMQGNRAPIVSPVPTQIVDENRILNVQIEATDDPEQTLTYRLLRDDIEGLTLNRRTGRLRFAPNEAQGPGTFAIPISVSDNLGLATAITVDIQTNEVNVAPELELLEDQQIGEGGSVFLTAVGSDADLPTQSLKFSLGASSPADAEIDPITGEFSWTHQGLLDANQVVPVEVILSDSLGATDSETFVITVVQGNRPPVISPIRDETINEGDTVQLQVEASDAAGQTLNYSLNSDAPQSASIDPITGEFTFETSELDGPGVATFVVTVRDNLGAATNSSFEVAVLEVNLPPVVQPIQDAVIALEEVYSTIAIATDSDLPANNLAFDFESAPEGASIDPVSGEIGFSSAVAGTFDFVVRVSDGELSDTTAFSVEVAQLDCLFEQSEITFAESGGEAGAAGMGEHVGCSFVLTEGTSFETSATVSFAIPETASSFVFEYDDLMFDGRDPGSVSDAFEVALLDQDGNSVVQTIGAGQDAFFNVSEPNQISSGVNTVVDGNRVSIDLSNLVAGENVSVVFRLVNNDDDVATSVRVTPVEFGEGLGTPVDAVQTGRTVDSTPIALDLLTNVTGSFEVQYGTTSFNRDSSLLFAEVTFANRANHPIDGPYVLVVSGISDPTVVLARPDGVTDSGDRYYLLSGSDGTRSLAPGEFTAPTMLEFLNPNGTQFGFDLDILAQPNNAPEFVTLPNTEGTVDRPYIYASEAEDEDNDALSYKLMVGPEGLSVDEESGVLNWNPTANDVGTHSVLVEVVDGRGGIDMQQYDIEVLEERPNRPPVIVSSPVVETTLGEQVAANAEASFQFVELTPADVGSDNNSRFSVLPTNDPTLFGIEGNVHKVNFDTDPFGNPISSGSFITTQYESVGLVMNDFQVTSSVFGGPASAPNATFTPANPGEALVFQFVVPVISVGFINTSPDQDLVEFLDRNGEVIFSTRDQDDQSSPNFNVDRFIGLVADPSRPIASLRVTNNSGNLELDELVFSPVEASYQYLVEARDPDLDPVQFELVESPEGMIVNSETGLIQWTPSADQLGVHNVQIRASDGRGGTAVQEYQVSVLGDATNTAPVIVSNPVEDFFVPGFSNPSSGNVTPQRIALDLGNGETFEGTVSITLADEAARFADIVLAVDESASMGGDQAWVAEMIPLLDTALQNAGIGSEPEFPNRFGIIGFGGGRDGIVVGHFLNSEKRSKYTLYGPQNQIVAEGLLNDVVPDELLNAELTSDGNYVLVVEPQNREDLEDGIQIGFEGQTRESTRQLNYTLGEVVEDVLNPGQPVEYIFNIAADTLVYFDSLAKDNRIQRTIIGPNGDAIGGVDQNFDITPRPGNFLHLLQAGEYRIIVDSRVDVAADYKFQLLNLGTAPEIQSGESYLAEFELGNETLAYRFQATQGTLLELVNLTEGVNPLSQWQLVGPSGDVLSIETIGTNVPIFEIPQTGQYVLLFESNFAPGEGSAQLRIPAQVEFSVTLSDPVPATRIVFGESVADEIDFVGAFHDYAFTLNERSLVYLDSLTDSRMRWSLSGPEGIEVDRRRFDSTDSFHNASPVLDLESGDYQIRIDGDGLTGQFAFRVLDLEDAVPIAPETPVEDVLDIPNQTNVYVFDASEGDEFYIDIVTTSDSINTQFKLVDEFGQVTHISDRLRDLNVVIPRSGVYTLLVEGARANEDSDTYTLNLVPVSVTDSALTLGARVDGALSTPGARASYSFDVTSDTLLYFDSLKNDSNLRWQLAGPRGIEISNRRFDKSDSLDIASVGIDVRPGSYTLTVFGVGDLVRDFSFRLTDLADVNGVTQLIPNPGMDNPSVNESGSVLANESLIYSFMVEAGDEFNFVTSNVGSSNIYYRVIDRFGNEVITRTNIAGDSLNRVFENEGLYFLLVEGRINNATQSEFSIDVEWVQNNGEAIVTGTVLDLNETVTANLEVGTADTYLFSLNSRALLYFDALTEQR